MAHDEQHFKRLASEYRTYSSGKDLAGYVAVIAVAAGFILLDQFRQTPQIILNIVIAGTVFVVASVISALTFKRALDVRPENEELAVITAFEAYSAIKRLIDTNPDSVRKRDVNRKTAKEKLDELNTEVLSWLGKGPPSFLAKPIDDFVKQINEKAIPVVLKGTDQQLVELRDILYVFMTQLEHYSKAEPFISLTERFNFGSLEHVPEMPNKDYWLIFKKHHIVRASIFGVIVGGILAAVVFLSGGEVPFSLGIGGTSAIAATAIGTNLLKK